ncbi:MAG TPA: sigma-70 family RNA polymerase sigma factor [Candidatus Dojkabacteria bacterium]|nr:sigma-70 family RNA polymerase sigma factor [Candidatus Dojkabacteria bacterium]HQF36926.1 sigma-70 family RNA polymerase sigma factor [Candidatus Dojkabacteria bacterium]
MEEANLIVEAKLGNKDAWQKLYEQTFTYMYKFVYSQTLHKEQTEDILSESYTKAFLNIKKFRAESSFKTWLYKIVKNELFRNFNKNKHIIQLTEEQEELIGKEDKDLSEEEERRKTKSLQILVQNILHKLPKVQSEILNLRFLLGYSIKETAEQMGISESNVKVIQHRAIKNARENYSYLLSNNS